MHLALDFDDIENTKHNIVFYLRLRPKTNKWTHLITGSGSNFRSGLLASCNDANMSAINKTTKAGDAADRVLLI